MAKNLTPYFGIDFSKAGLLVVADDEYTSQIESCIGQRYSNNIQKVTFENLDKINLENHNFEYLIIANSNLWHKIDKKVIANKFTSIYCDVSDINSSLELYSVWCWLHNTCQNLLLTYNMFGSYQTRKFDFQHIEISIIFPVYNVASYLENCFKNFLAFKDDFVEFLAVNDGSPDNSVEILQEMAEKDSRIKVLSKQNGGCASARMHGLENAKGRYVAFIDPDDFVDPDFLAKLHMNAVFSDCQVVQCGYNNYYMEANTYEPQNDGHGLKEFYTPRYSYLDPFYQLGRINNIAIWRRLYKRDFLLENNITFPPHIKRFDDLPFFFEVFCKCVSFIAIPDKLYNYRLNRPGQDVAIDDERLFVHFDIFQHMEKFYLENTNQDINVENNLLITRIRSHVWALLLLNKKYYAKYIKELIRDFALHRKKFMRSVSFISYHYGRLKTIELIFFIGIYLKNSLIIKFAMVLANKKRI